MSSMRVSCNPHYVLVVALAFTLISSLLQINTTNRFFTFYSPLSFSTESLSRPLPPPSPLSRQEEKRQRWAKRLNDAIEQIVPWRRREDDDQLESLEMGLARARALIRKALLVQNDNVSSTSLTPTSSIYKNAFAFHRSYSVMEKTFKIYVYEEGEPPIFHDGPCSNIYSIEGLFINQMEKETHFKTLDPTRAHAFFLPFSVARIVKHLFHPVVRDKAVLERVLVDYVRTISTKHPYWNRSIGVDHFMLSCHDWGPRATRYHPLLYYRSIRALCNANTSEYFYPEKDASIPEINFPSGGTKTLHNQQTLAPSNRSILAFFAGRNHGFLRRPLFRHWLGKDDEIQVFQHLPKGLSYTTMMMRSKYCICPSGFEVASPRIVEAIYVGCVPVLINQDYVLPFSDVLDWDEFSVRVSVEEIPDLKTVLMGISEEKYLRLYENVKRVKRHFVVNDPPLRYDVFHMIVHSIWLRRLNVRINS